MALPDDLPEALSHVRWIGGGSGAAKSTVARMLADVKGAVVYDTDAAMRDHADRCPRDQCPKLASFIDMTMDERWVDRTPQEILETFHWFAGEGFGLIIEDLVALPRQRLVIAEGFRLLPRLVAPLLGDKRHALWLLPTAAFRRQAFDTRGTTWDIPRRTSNPDVALANILERDALFTDRLRGEAATLGLNTLQVDGALNEDALLARIGDLLFR